MISSFGFRLVDVLEPTYVLCICNTVVKLLNGTVYKVFLAPRVLLASLVLLLSILSWSRHWDLPTCRQCSGSVDCIELMAIAQAVLPYILGKSIKNWCGMSLLWMLCTQSHESRLFMQRGNHRHRG